MPWVDVAEPYAAPPKVPTVEPAADAGPLTIDRGWAELDGVAVDAATPLDLTGCAELEIVDSTLTGVSFAGVEPEFTLEVRRSVLRDCDLSGITVRSARSCHLQNCKLVGTDLSGAAVTDAIVDRCSLRLANLRMARFTRVCVRDSTLDDVDAFELTATDVAFPGSRLVDVAIDRLTAERVDLREAAELGFAGGRVDLAGCLVADHQVPALSYWLAFAAGLGVERPPE